MIEKLNYILSEKRKRCEYENRQSGVKEYVTYKRCEGEIKLKQRYYYG